ncbi:glycosyltransferase [Bacillus sp. AFS088145]|uniref:glycosyltransferase n=1 Tax=Bacillus sp. AFS088145 TaxID=2033514 RepID=UPI000BF3A0EF|nr:glycosyltransferase [Bacillus sp. AFS088145]PFH87081.1 glycosyl transferase family 1 [Bacillus sp. AFS088145]
MKILIYDVHASESGALEILNDLYKQISEYEDKSIKWIFAVSKPEYKEQENIITLRYPWVKKSWFHRLYFDYVVTRKILKRYKPDKVFSLQNKGISFYKKPQCVYLHLPSVLTDHKFNLRRDGKILWLHQNVLKKMIFASLRKVDKTIVQTQWMKDALIEKAKVKDDKIILLPPDISTNNIGKFSDDKENRINFFYPAASYTYKNHLTVLKACKYIQEKGVTDYKVTFTIRPDENKHTEMMYKYVMEHNLKIGFDGSIPREKVFKNYQQSVLLFPSFIESFGLPLLEARLSGSFIVASDSPFAREILDNYNNALFFEYLDYKALGDHMIQIMTVQKYEKINPIEIQTHKKESNKLTEIVLNL